MTFGESHIAADFRIVTPIFLGDAEQEATRISAASIKGALVFWWRALHFAGLMEKAGGNIAEALESLQAREQERFGGPKGQSRVLLKIEAEELDKRCEKGVVLPDASGAVVGPGARYLGYGLLNAFHMKAKPNEDKPEIKAGQLLRSCFLGGSFTLRLMFRPGTTEGQRAEVLRALKALGLLGGLGSRARRGWGSLALTRLEWAGVESGWKPPQERDQYIQQLKEVLGDRPKISGAQFPLTALAAESDLRVGTRAGADSLKVLNGLGEDYKAYRAEVPKHKRYRLGLPTPLNNPCRGHDRRASPLLLHLHKVGDTYLPVALFFPTLFAPDHQHDANTGKPNFLEGEPVLP